MTVYIICHAKIYDIMCTAEVTIHVGNISYISYLHRMQYGIVLVSYLFVIYSPSGDNPVAYQVIFEPGIWSVSGARAPPSGYWYKFVGIFSCAQIDLQKVRERGLAKLDERSTSSGIAEPYAR